MNPNLNSNSQSRNKFIGEFEGLRGILAAWVVFGHILLFSGYTYQDGWFGVLFSPVLGVYAFMMVSGFVITAALDQRPTTWTKFISRRFWRLFPVYLLCMILAICMFKVSTYVAQSHPFGAFGTENLQRLDDVRDNFGVYIVADSTLLQCLLPRNWFPYAHESILPPTWSLTIEWLFYMVAPLLLLLIKRGKWFAIGGSASLIMAVYFLQPWLTEFVNRSFHLGNVFHFATGMVSFYVWKHLPERKNCWATKILFWTAIVGGGLILSLPYKIWLATMAIVLFSRVHQRQFFLVDWPRRFLTSKPLQFMGRTSYVTYLLHWIVIELVLFWIIRFAPGLNDRLILAVICTLAVYPLTYVVSDLVHRNIEVPCIGFGKKRNHPVSINTPYSPQVGTNQVL